MAYDIIVGRDSSDKERFGDKGLIFLGKSYVKMGNYTSLSNNLYMDIARSHVVLIAGKRGSGKSYSIGVIAEELAQLPQEVSQNIAALIFDTMGIFWTMKYENEKEKDLLNTWDLKPKGLPVRIFVPFGKTEEYKNHNIPFDETFSIPFSELEAEDWITLFNLPLTALPSLLIQRIIPELKKKLKQFTFKELFLMTEHDKKSSKETKEIVSSLFNAAENWGIFSKEEGGKEITDLVLPGTTTVLDISVYSSIGSYNIRALVISLISRKLFTKRLDARKQEELQALSRGQEYLSYQQERKQPLIWMFIDEAHEFLPKDLTTPATLALQQILREGRQPGISLVLATQQPGQIHQDAITQADILIAHRVTAKADLEALNEAMQSYVLENIKQAMDQLPSLKGSAIVLDDNSERLYPIRIRPRLTWHGGEAPTAVKAKIRL